MMRIALAGICCLFTSLAMAESTEQQFSPLSIRSLLETGGGLLLILMLIIGGAWLFKHFGQLPMAGKGAISILGGVSVGPRERVVLLKVEDIRLVVGVAPGQVRTLHVLDAKLQTENDFASQLATEQGDPAGEGVG